MKKPEYIIKLEEKENVFSSATHKLDGELIKFLSERKLSRVYEVSTINSDGVMIFDDVIFKSQQNFYLFVENKTVMGQEPRFALTIYYKAEQYNELFLFLSQLLKQYRNAAINSNGNQTKN